MRRPCLFVLLLVVLGVLASGDAIAGRGESRGPIVGAGRVVLTIEAVDASGADVYAANPDGTGLRQLTHGGDHYEVAPSPDGSRIAYRDDDRERIVVAGSDGSHPESLPCAFDPAWSPDGREIACSRTAGFAVVDVRSRRRVRVYAFGQMPVWSPTGAAIAVVRDDSAPGDGIYVVPLRGRAPRRLSALVPLGPPAWTPDGRRLVFADGRGRLDILDVATGTRRLLIGGPEAEGSLAVAPDGSAVAYDARTGTGPSARTDVYVARLDGRGRHRVSASLPGEAAQDPAWLPDSQHLLYRATRFRFPAEAYGDAYLVARDGSGRRLIPADDAAVERVDEVRWSAGSRLAFSPPATPRPLVLVPSSRVALAAVVDRAKSGAGRLSVAPGCWVLVWDGATKGPQSIRGGCPAGGPYETALEDWAVAGKKVLWLLDEGQGDFNFYTLMLGDLATGASRQVASASDEGDGVSIDNLAGDGDLFAFNTVTTQPRLWLLPLDGGTTPCPGASGGDRSCVRGPIARVLAAGGGRVAAAKGHSVLILGPDGRLTQTVRFGAPVSQARLTRQRLVTVDGSTLECVTLATGARRSFDIGAAGRHLVLLDADGRLALVRGDGHVSLVDLHSGRIQQLVLPGATPPFTAQLESGGLFYASQVAHAQLPGRLSFIPNKALSRALG